MTIYPAIDPCESTHDYQEKDGMEVCSQCGDCYVSAEHMDLDDAVYHHGLYQRLASEEPDNTFLQALLDGVEHRLAEMGL